MPALTHLCLSNGWAAPNAGLHRTTLAMLLRSTPALQSIELGPGPSAAWLEARRVRAAATVDGMPLPSPPGQQLQKSVAEALQIIALSALALVPLYFVLGRQGT